jgi:hypothetical protein
MITNIKLLSNLLSTSHLTLLIVIEAYSRLIRDNPGELKYGGRIKLTAERTVVNQNGTLYVSIPKAFADRHKIQAGDRLAMFLGLDSIKIIAQEKT